MLEKLKSILKSDAFSPSLAVFPAIDTQALSERLAIRKKAKERAESNQPDSSSAALDSVEMDIISSVETSRRTGLESYQNHLKVYKDRVSKISQVKQEVQIIAGKAKTDFEAAISVWSNQLQNELRDVEETYKGYQDFKIKNRLDRPAMPEPNVLFFWSLSFFLLLVESIANGLLFAEDNPMGLIGGIGVALLVAVLNVGIAMIGGFFGRYFNSVRVLPKAFGVAISFFWLSGAIGFNLAVGHFRDVIGQNADLRSDGIIAVQNIINNPFDITQFNSWILVGVGLLISVAIYWKTYQFGDPYPGYGQIARQLRAARQKYANRIESSIDSVLQQRDEAVSELREVQDLMAATIEDSIQALTGQANINAHLQAFLEQCDLKVNELLAVYRDENRIYRSTEAPARFDQSYKFPPFKPEASETVDLDEAKRENTAIGESIKTSIDEIFNKCQSTLDKYKKIEDLESLANKQFARVD
jgi:hypothetical protein